MLPVRGMLLSLYGCLGQVFIHKYARRLENAGKLQITLLCRGIVLCNYEYGVW